MWLALWRAFYVDWDRLDCVAAPGDRTIELPVLEDVWATVATGRPTLLEIEGLPDPDAPDIDQPLLVLEDLLRPLLAGGFTAVERTYDADGEPDDVLRVDSKAPHGDPLVVVLATRNQAVDDATAMVQRLTETLDLPDGAFQASTVDCWQGQTNRITIGIHPAIRSRPARRLELRLRTAGRYLHPRDPRPADDRPRRPR